MKHRNCLVSPLLTHTATKSDYLVAGVLEAWVLVSGLTTWNSTPSLLSSGSNRVPWKATAVVSTPLRRTFFGTCRHTREAGSA